MKDTIEETPLGGKSLASILENNTFDEPANGLASLLSKDTTRAMSQTKTQVQQVTTEFYPSDISINNEFLRIEREKNQLLNDSLDSLMTLPDQMNKLHKKIEDLTHFEEMNSLDHELEKDMAKNNLSMLKEKRSFLYVVMSMCIVFGLIIGKFFFTQAPAKVLPLRPLVQTKPIKKIVLLETFVTTKFVNMRSLNSPKSEIITMISPNQVVTKTDKRGGWIKVEAKDHINDKKFVGWVWFENLKKI